MGKQINTHLSLYHLGADLAIVCSACGDPENVGESLRFFLWLVQTFGNGNIAQNYKNKTL